MGNLFIVYREASWPVLCSCFRFSLFFYWLDAKSPQLSDVQSLLVKHVSVRVPSGRRREVNGSCGPGRPTEVSHQSVLVEKHGYFSLHSCVWQLEVCERDLLVMAS